MIKIVFANQKGGVGKTTTTLVVASFLAKNYRVLAVDGDPQANFTFVACKGKNFDKTLDDVLAKRLSIKDTIVKADIADFDLIAGSLDLADADRRFTDFDSHMLLSKALSKVEGDYDYCIIDSPPSLGILSVNYFMCSDWVVVPINASAFSLQGLSQLNEIISKAKEYNKNLNYAGILITRVVKNARNTVLAKETLEAISKDLEINIFTSMIRQSVIVDKSQIEQENLISYALKNKNNIAKDYEAFLTELQNQICSNG